MAGRPLRRSRMNPLLHWERNVKGSVGSYAAPVRVMLLPESEKKFREALDKSDQVLLAKGLLPIPLSISIGDEHDYEVAKTVGFRTKSLVLSQHTVVSDDSSAKPGDSLRVTPFTPFNLFHRLEHVLLGGAGRIDPARGKFFAGNIEQLSFMPPSLVSLEKAVKSRIMSVIPYHVKGLPFEDSAHKVELRKAAGVLDAYNPAEAEKWLKFFYSVGLDTASGRLRSLLNEEAYAEAFALYATSIRPINSWNLRVKEHGLSLPGDYRKETEMESDVISAKHFLMSYMELRSAVLAACLGLFIHGYYTGEIEDITLKLSDDTLTDLENEEDLQSEEAVEDPKAFYTNEIYEQVVKMLSLCRLPRGVPRPGLFVDLIG